MDSFILFTPAYLKETVSATLEVTPLHDGLGGQDQLVLAEGWLVGARVNGLEGGGEGTKNTPADQSFTQGGTAAQGPSRGPIYTVVPSLLAPGKAVTSLITDLSINRKEVTI